MIHNIEFKNDWVLIPAPGRWDAFNFSQSHTDLQQLAKSNKKLAIDVRDVQFVSIQMIKALYETAQTVTQNGGRFALIGSTEKLKRQIDIFASLGPFSLYSSEDWDDLINTSAEGHA